MSIEELQLAFMFRYFLISTNIARTAWRKCCSTQECLFCYI